jgi:dTDP-4-amino-4,6-dideoxy-D-galactose acyltransferase
MTEPLCEIASWDTQFFGCRIARVRTARLQPETIREILEWSEERKVDCLYFLASSDDPPTLRLAEEHGFNLVDIRVMLEARGCPLRGSDDDGDVTVRPFAPADLPPMLEIARTAYRFTRFYADRRFPVEKCDALYATWLRQSCEGKADAVYVATRGGVIEGYISCHGEPAQAGRIGLVGVDAAAEGRRVGPQLVREALRWFGQKGIGAVTVVTQGRNCRAQRLYQRCGFVTRSLDLWYHRWVVPR